MCALHHYEYFTPSLTAGNLSHHLTKTNIKYKCPLIWYKGHPQGSHTVRTARQLLLDNFNRIKRPDIESDDRNDEKRRPTSAPSKTDGKKNIKLGEDSIEFDAKSVKSRAAPQKMDTEEILMVCTYEHDKIIS